MILCSKIHPIPMVKSFKMKLNTLSSLKKPITQGDHLSFFSKSDNSNGEISKIIKLYKNKVEQNYRP